MASRGSLVFVLGLSLVACRKAEPDEIVTPPRRSSSAEGSSAAILPATGGAATTLPSGSGSTGGFAGVDGGTVSPGLQCDLVPRVIDVPFTKARLLEAAADCAMAQYCQFAAVAERLRDSAMAYGQQLTEESLAAARAAWLDAMQVWEQTEVFRFGPAAPAPQGKDYRDLVYSWPRDVRCRVDEQTVSEFYATEAFFGPPSQSFVNGRSLATLEYLLFYGASDNGCTQFSSINATGSWQALSALQLQQRKALYATAAAQDVLATAYALVREWQPGHGNYLQRFTQPGTANGAYPDEQSALDAVNYGLFYLEKEVKDWKLAVPMGLSPDCAAVTCPDRIESRYAGHMARGLENRHLQANLAGFRRLFQGCGPNGQGLGFDDWLQQLGANELAERMLQALTHAEDLVANLEVPISEAIGTQPERVMAIYDAIKAVSDPLKSEVLSTLNLQVPQTSETDND